MADEPPLILTLGFDAESFARLDGLRRRHFPPERNLIPAHLTLFHHLPGAEEPAIMAELARVTSAQAPMALTVAGLRSLGKGVAFAVDSPDLVALRARLASSFGHWLTPQDRQGFRPHVTIQNKVTPEAARDLLGRLQAGFSPWPATGEGLLLWRYLGGPWEARASVPFSPSAPPAG